jgi:hypothetical protein
MNKRATFPLTPALSPRERENVSESFVKFAPNLVISRFGLMMRKRQRAAAVQDAGANLRAMGFIR